MRECNADIYLHESCIKSKFQLPKEQPEKGILVQMTYRDVGNNLLKKG